MKGITPIIAVILLLLITVSMVGFAFVWFNRMMITATNQTGSQIESQTQQVGKTIRIDSISAGAVSVRNTGSITIQTSEVSVYVAGALRTTAQCAWTTAPITPGSTSVCTIVCPASQVVRVTAPGNYDEVTC